MLTTSCVGSFSLFNKLASWNKDATGSKFLNEIIFIVISPAYAVCSVADALVLNSIEFWSGSNPIASNVGKTVKVQGQDGRYYAVKTLKNGYEIKAPDGKVTCFVYDKNNDSWSQMENGKLVEIFRFNDNGTIQVNLGDKKMVSPEILPKLPDIIKTASTVIKTDMSVTELLDFAQQMKAIHDNGLEAKMVPGPSWGISSSLPWWRCTISRAMESPRPVPPDSRERALSTR